MVLDRAINAHDRDITEAASELVSSLIATAPRGCEVAGIAPRAAASDPSDPSDSGFAPSPSDVWHAPLRPRELAAAWRMGATFGAAAGMIHSPSLMAPLVRHDRAHNHDQTVVTLWSLEPWTAPERLDRRDVAWQRAMLRRATRFADAVIVPTHAMAAELAEIAPLGARVRVIAGAPQPGFDRREDAPAVARKLGLPERYIAVVGRAVDLVSVFRAAAGLSLDVVVIGDGSDDPARIFALAQGEGLPENRVRAPHVPDVSDRASVLANAVAVVAPSGVSAYPWRALEALATGSPLISARTAQNEELFADGAHFVETADPDELAGALERVTADEAFAARLRVLSADRARAFSWRDAAERVWQLHAEL